MARLEIIGGNPLAGKFANISDTKERVIGPSGEHSKDHFYKVVSIINPVGAHRPLSQPVIYGDYIFRIMHIVASGAHYPHIQVIQKNTLNVIRMIKVSDITMSGNYTSLQIKNGKFVFFGGNTSNGALSHMVTGTVDNLIQEATKSTSSYIVDAFSLFTTTGTIPDSQIGTEHQSGNNGLVYDGVNSVYLVSAQNISKITVPTGAVVWKKTFTELTGVTTGNITSVHLLSDRVAVTAMSNSPQDTYLMGLKLTDGSTLTSKTIKIAGTYGGNFRDIGVIGQVGNDIVVKGTIFIGRFNAMTLDTVWFKRFPYVCNYLPARLNLAYNEIILTFYESAPADHTAIPPVKIDLDTGLEKKVLYNIAVNDMNYIYHIDGEYILGADSGLHQVSQYVETERVV